MKISDLYPLNEGLIKLPANLVENIDKFIKYYVCWIVRDSFDVKKRKQNPEDWKLLQQYIKNSGFKYSKDKCPIHEDGLILKSFTFSTEDLPEKYRHLKSDRDTVTVAIDVFGKSTISRHNSNAVHRTKNSKDGKVSSVVIIGLHNNRAFKKIMSSYPDIAELYYLFSELHDSLFHELQHMMQYALLQHVDKTQVKTLPKYSEHGDDYYNSPIEFDPTITSEVGEFLSVYEMLSKLKSKVPVSLNDAMRITVGMKKSTIGNGYAISTFFKSLKRTDPEKYKLAVKKFVAEVSRRLDQKRLPDDHQ